jgi:hypothetical protein
VIAGLFITLAIITAVWMWAFRAEICDVWMSWQVEREFRRRHREKSR